MVNDRVWLDILEALSPPSQPPYPVEKMDDVGAPGRRVVDRQCEEGPHLLHRGGRMDVEWASTSKGFVHRDAQGPPVDRPSVPRDFLQDAAEDFGSWHWETETRLVGIL